MSINSNTRIIDLTIGEFEEWLNSKGLTNERESAHQTTQYVYGLNGIMHLFGCSKSKAKRLKDGVLAPAVCQNGRSIVVDAKKAMELFNTYK